MKSQKDSRRSAQIKKLKKTNQVYNSISYENPSEQVLILIFDFSPSPNGHGGKNEDVQYKERLNMATWTMSIGHGGGNGDNAKEEETVKHDNSQPGLRCNDIWALTPLLCLCSGCNEEKLE